MTAGSAVLLLILSQQLPTALDLPLDFSLDFLTTHWLQVGWLADTYNRRNMLFIVAVIGQVPCLCTLWVSAWPVHLVVKCMACSTACFGWLSQPALGMAKPSALSSVIRVPCWRVQRRMGPCNSRHFTRASSHAFCLRHSLLLCLPLPTQVTQYWQFLFTRMLTGISVGGVFPLLYSLLSDMFPVTQRWGAWPGGCKGVPAAGGLFAPWSLLSSM